MGLKKLMLGAGLGTVMLVGVAAPAFAADDTTSTTTPTPTAPDDTIGRACLPEGADDAWPAAVQGSPTIAGDAGGAFLWHDASGWHLRVTHTGDDKAVIRGRIVSRGTFRDVDGVRLESGDKVTTARGGHAIRFAFKNYGHIDGLDFKTVCAPAIGVGLAVGGKVLPADRVFLGAGSTHPASDPFRIRRTNDKAPTKSTTAPRSNAGRTA